MKIMTRRRATEIARSICTCDYSYRAASWDVGEYGHMKFTRRPYLGRTVVETAMIQTEVKRIKAKMAACSGPYEA